MLWRLSACSPYFNIFHQAFLLLLPLLKGKTVSTEQGYPALERKAKTFHGHVADWLHFFIFCFHNKYSIPAFIWGMRSTDGEIWASCFTDKGGNLLHCNMPFVVAKCCRHWGFQGLRRKWSRLQPLCLCNPNQEEEHGENICHVNNELSAEAEDVCSDRNMRIKRHWIE